MKKKFKKYLEKTSYPQKFEGWHIKGMLKGNSNNVFKFDLSNIIKKEDDHYERNGSFKSKADKMVFESKDEWIILDVRELNNYIKINKLKDVNFNKLLEDLEWTSYVKK
jgi:phosphoserine aminotransferase|tara:strand:+ start:1205 stop:1531 length:327 start_codon:yes stop_codon:yes gene_type:complete